MPKGKMKFRAEPVRTAPCDGGVRTIQKIYIQFEKVSGGADGGVAGFNGSIRPKCLAQVLRALSVEDNELVDFGAGSGRVLISAVAEGASRSYGYELPENEGMKYIFDAMVIASATLTKDRVEWVGKDIVDLRELNGSPSCAFSFWVGFPLPVQGHILHGSELTLPDLPLARGSGLVRVARSKKEEGADKRHHRDEGENTFHETGKRIRKKFFNLTVPASIRKFIK